MVNCPEMLEVMFACFKIGCGAVSINFRLHPNEFSFIIDRFEVEISIWRRRVLLAFSLVGLPMRYRRR